MSILEEVKSIVIDTLQLSTDPSELVADTTLLGGIPEFDSMAVVAIITAFEENYGFEVEDDEIDAETFETLGSLAAFVESKLN